MKKGLFNTKVWKLSIPEVPFPKILIALGKVKLPYVSFKPKRKCEQKK